MLSEEQITKFQTLWKNRFGETICREEAIARGIHLIRLVGIIYKPMTEQEFEKLQNRRRETDN